MLEVRIETNAEGADTPSSATANDERDQEVTANDHGLGEFCYQPREKNAVCMQGQLTPGPS